MVVVIMVLTSSGEEVNGIGVLFQSTPRQMHLNILTRGNICLMYYTRLKNEFLTEKLDKINSNAKFTI